MGVCSGRLKKGVLGAGTARKRGVLGAGPTRKKGGLRCGSGQKRGSLPRHIPILNIYVRIPPPPPRPGQEPDTYIYRRPSVPNKTSALCVGGRLRQIQIQIQNNFIVPYTYMYIGVFYNKVNNSY